jgi:hypothetical protein
MGLGAKPIAIDGASEQQHVKMLSKIKQMQTLQTDTILADFPLVQSNNGQMLVPPILMVGQQLDIKV